ncbi:putative clathrin assembly protein At4g40080 [Lotus japonicus]|uniref:putative clathrin assembly protein At4g40080 n=1 Tax=Lotus japonicus TaxID=34305 RepID=UPI002583B7C6|nr:putative clathrin assembly protein At4g40080 [Lotus japonicus]
MTRFKILADNLKDKASVLAAALSIKRQVSSVKVRVLRATTHNLSAPPSEDTIAAVLAAGRGSYLLPRACIDALMDRLHRTRSAAVALKCLFTLHNVVVKGSFALKDTLSCYPSYGGRNFLNLSDFRDDTDFESIELSSWVRWYASVVEQSLTVSRVMGYYLTASNSSMDKKKDTQELESLVLKMSNADLLYKLENLVVFVEQIGRVPESLHLQRNELVYEVVRLVGEDYRSVQGEILWRLEELENRVTEDMDVGELSELVGYLNRLEETQERLVLLFVNRRRNNGLWDLIKKTKVKALEKKEETEGKWLTVVVSKNAASAAAAELTRSTNPFLEPGQVCPVLPLGFATVR